MDATAHAEVYSGEITMTQVDVGDFTFDVRTAGPGDGEVVILLHGFPQTSYEWRHQLSGLAEAGFSRGGAEPTRLLARRAPPRTSRTTRCPSSCRM